MTLVSRDASLGSFGLDMMGVTVDALIRIPLPPLTTPGTGTNADWRDMSLWNPASRTITAFGSF